MEQPSNGRKGNKVHTPTSPAGRYLLYAIGEILLVVIGILIALQVNNWNQQRYNEQKANELATNLISEFNQNLIQLDNLSGIHEQTKIVSVYLLASRENKDAISYDKSLLEETWQEYYNIEYDEETVLDTLWYTGFMWTYDPLNGALRTGITSGDINLLSSESLKAKLFAWEDLVKDLDEEETRLINHEISFHSFKDGYVPPMYLINRISDGSVPPSNFKPGIKQMLQDPEFENYLFRKLIEIRNIEVEMNVLKEEATEIIYLLEKELE